MPVGPGIDQLDADYDLISAPSDAAFEHVHHAERLRDLRQIVFRRTPIWHHRSAADDFQVVDLRQAGEDVVLDSIREESVLFVVAKIVEGQDGNALLGDARRSRAGMVTL